MQSHAKYLSWETRDMKLLRKVKHEVLKMTLGAATRRVMRDRLTYLSIGKLRRIEAAIRETSEVRGDILEFGVALGGSGIILAHAANNTKRFVGFDVFGMIPPPTSEKDDEKSKSRYQDIAGGKSKGLGGETYYGYRDDLFSQVATSFSRHGVPLSSQVVLHKGLFEDTWMAAMIKHIALAHIDCDWYDPVKFCLEVCGDKLSRGGILVIDDYSDYGGCRTAVDEFVKSRADFSIEHGPNAFLRKH